MPMKQSSRFLLHLFVTASILAFCFGISLILQKNSSADSLFISIFVLGAFLTALLTDRYLYGISFSLVSVLAVNFAFTFPYFHLNFSIPENLVSAVIMMVISVVTCTLTTKLKTQEAIKARGEKEKMRADLLRAVSHDLRTPLTTIYGASSTLMEHTADLSQEQKFKMLQSIKEDAQWLTAMVENLLSITKLDDKNVKIIKTSIVLDEFVDSVLIKFQKRHPGKEILIDLPEEFISIPMDAMLIQQVVINLLDNAVQHAKGMTELHLQVFTRGMTAVFEIWDNGCGIAPERLRHIFDGYACNDSVPPDSSRSNAGIGLSVCSAIIKAHGGTIQAQNRKDGGALFRFTLDMDVLNNEQ